MIRQTKTKENICMQEGKVKTISHLCRLNNSYSCLGKTVTQSNLMHERKIKWEAKYSLLMNLKALTVN